LDCQEMYFSWFSGDDEKLNILRVLKKWREGDETEDQFPNQKSHLIPERQKLCSVTRSVMEWKASLGNEEISNRRGGLFDDFLKASLSLLIEIRQRPNGHLFQNSHRLVWKYILISLPRRSDLFNVWDQLLIFAFYSWDFIRNGLCRFFFGRWTLVWRFSAQMAGAVMGFPCNSCTVPIQFLWTPENHATDHRNTPALLGRSHQTRSGTFACFAFARPVLMSR
jgi:hypothetical protein